MRLGNNNMICLDKKYSTTKVFPKIVVDFIKKKKTL
jgi:hypothetical protein